LDKLGNAFGKVLRIARTQAGLTQEKLGFEAGIQRKYVSELELGQKSPSLDTVLKICRAVGVPPGAFITLVVSAMEESNSES
jgi:transcriptional regulator with XRE-family HTH domain